MIPTADKLGVDDMRSGVGVRIAFLDSGFYPHPDFVDRVFEFHDIAGEERSFHSIRTPMSYHWHGTQTVTACAGDGSLSDGVYRGLAYRSELVLVKVSRAGSIGDAEIEAGLEWVLQHSERLKIRVLNMSLGGDADVSSGESRINNLIEELSSRGVVVTVAAGNSSDSHSSPPASAPAAITVGGYSDENQFGSDGFDLYHSNYGHTVDGLVKPELIAPAMYVAAPILPETPDYLSAELLSMLASSPDYAFDAMLAEHAEEAGLENDVLRVGNGSGRRLVEIALQRRKIVSTHYQHVDGTSFAAPITASVVALMLEANPKLTPTAVKNILVSTASRLAGHPAIRQGFGVLNAREAIACAESEVHELADDRFHPPRIVGSEIIFRFHHDLARTVHIAGDFNDWDSSLHVLELCSDGLWKIAIPCRPPGRYRYKFLIDEATWTEDPSHALKEADEYGGFNSVLIVDG